MSKAPALSYPDLRALKPCSESLTRVAKLMGGAKKWDGKKVSAAAARRAGATFDDIVWVASAVARSEPDVERRLRLWLADCAARVLHIYEADYPADDRPRDAIIATRRFARGEIKDAARAAARDAATAAAWAAAWDARAAARAAATAAEEAWQFDRLIAWLSAKEPEDYPLPERAAKKQAA